MDAEHKIWNNIDHDLTSNLLSKISVTVECSICSDTMNIPYTLECGHTFCYECLKNWFKNKLNCPSCRFNILHKPVLNISLKEITKNIQDLRIELNDNNDEKQKLINHRNDQITSHETDKHEKSLFDNIFNHTSVTLMDNSDGVPRCGNCHWEARGPICNHCGWRIQDPHGNGGRDGQEFYYDSMEGEDYDEDGDDDDVDLEEDMRMGDDQYDSEDSFVDTRGLTEIMLESNSHDDLLSTDDESYDSDNDRDGETIHRRARSTHSEESDWQGFESPENSADVDHGHVHRHDEPHNEPIEISEEEDDVHSSRQYYDSEDLRDALEEFHETDLHHLRDGDIDVDDDDDDAPRIVIRRTRPSGPSGTQRARRVDIVVDDDDSD